MAASRRLQIPLVYRSHNIEHLYMRRQAEAAKTGRDRLAWTVACIGLRRFESSVIRQAGWVFDISIDDMEVWKSRGVRRISWMPPLAEAALVPMQAEFKFGSVGDVVFLGNLTTPNNVRGLEWLLQEIVPLVLADSPNTRFVIAGSNPGEHVRGLCAAAGVTLLPNPPDAIAVYLGARVLVNPVRTGSGTHVKAIEMLMTPLPIVTATQGTCGMPEEVKRLFRVADTAAEFARQILAALSTKVDYSSQRQDARSMFGVEGVARALEGLADRDGVRHVLART
jgi:glycosyltransferase involved in cell wall biosynthesis